MEIPIFLILCYVILWLLNVCFPWPWCWWTYKLWPSLCLPSVHRGGGMLLYLCPLSLSQSVSVSVPFISVQRFLSCRRSYTRRWPNAGLMLAHRLWGWANISPVFGYCVVFSVTLNVGQRHRRRANINPALVQSIVPVPPACQYRQHEVLTRAEWILASAGIGQIFRKVIEDDEIKKTFDLFEKKVMSKQKKHSWKNVFYLLNFFFRKLVTIQCARWAEKKHMFFL